MESKKEPIKAVRERMKLWIRGAKQIVQVVDDGSLVLKGKQMQKLAVLNQRQRIDGTRDGLSIVTDWNGTIWKVGYDSEVTTEFSDQDVHEIYDATNCCILPGFVDAHTHPVWSGDRVHEFSMKLAGATYMDIHNAGGGIHFTVDHTRRATEDDLYQTLRSRLNQMLQNGTTLAEAKSGYGLDLENELKMLRVLHRAANEGPVELSITYCGAHAVPRGRTAEEATEDIIQNQLPALKAELDAGNLKVHNIDVFCETNVFDVDQTRSIIEKGRELGLSANIHAEELSYLGGVEMAAELNAAAMSHLEHISDSGIQAMANSGSVAVLLPTTAFLLRLEPPPARKLIDNNVAVALGTDFNPNAYCLSMPIVMHLAAVLFRMSLPEVLAAATINAAASLKVSDKYGSIEPGKFADLVILQPDAGSWEHIVYQFGNASLIRNVIKKGDVVV